MPNTDDSSSDLPGVVIGLTMWPFCNQYVPAGTPAEDVVFYAYSGNKVRFKRNTNEDKIDLGEFKGKTEALSYDAATIFRDNFIKRQKGQTE